MEAQTDHGVSGNWEATIYASGHYARWREHGTRYNAPERVMSDYLRSIDPDADINNP
ncbi:hypothetical protein EBESD8_34550 [Rhodococcus aetherivorans]|nr:hypothetical protein EBESD8_34550 [Rhodococcus aetherivorans]